MLRIQADAGLAQTPKPCDYFDLIGGTSTGGLIALLLGRLGLSADDALLEYGKIGHKVFSDRKSSASEGMFKATKLEAAIRGIVKEFGNATHDADEEMKLLSDAQGAGQCRVSVI